ncbi:helix-turn-helix domain-containing protein [Pikeienuella piscinae]|uniref:Helix-turn-helix domain-containing protein n=1 Tax=Pikeienuella piscinae TaxID=2748098 RepID=A0A7L5BZV7_9RHOB|nr:helix-turn-helix domain-containing protein [Pikeienuella piscinae]QIE56653.1 helix-turn-helix domain-containing protein [Pikeienuella piscinae]
MTRKIGNPRLMTIRETAAEAGVCTRTVRRWIANGLLPVRHLGGSRRLVRIEENVWRAFLREA